MRNAHPDLKTSRQIYDESVKVRRQLDDGKPRQSEDDMQREQFGPRGVPGQPDPAKMSRNAGRKRRRISIPAIRREAIAAANLCGPNAEIKKGAARPTAPFPVLWNLTPYWHG